MKIYSDKSVYDASLERIRYLYSEFPEVICGFSGGKDSTVCLNLCLKVARELGRLPLTVLWIDQEVEWQGTVDFAEHVMTMPDVKPMWLQIPMVITNNASSTQEYNHCWKESEKDKWTHPKHPISIKENVYGTERFHDLFGAVLDKDFHGKKTCYISGMRTEESPKRFMCLTGGVTYKWITWGKKLDTKQGHYTFYPIYDWDWRDVWKAIYENGWRYNKVYDQMFRHGVAPRNMRISNLHHETAIQDLMLVQEIEPRTWVKVADRISGANAIKHVGKKSFTCPSELPFMFSKWDDYLIHLMNTMIDTQEHYDMVRGVVYGGGSSALSNYMHEGVRVSYIKSLIDSILCADWECIKLTNFVSGPDVHGYRKWRSWLNGAKEMNPAWLKNKYIPEEVKPDIAKGLEGFKYDENRFAIAKD